MNGQLNGLHVIKDSPESSAFIDEGTLSRLEDLLNEFFFPSTDNDRKRQIESILSDFSSLPNSWQMSFLYFERTNSEYTKMFCLTVIETFINQRWHTISDDIRTNFRNSLWNHLIEKHCQMTNPIRNKYCKTIVSIVRFDWPYSYPDYLTNVLELLTPETVHNIAHSSNLILLSLNLLGMTVEELTSSTSNYHFSSNRQTELVKLIESNLPNMLHSLSSLLELIISKHINFISATPPPSPTNSPPSSFNNINKANETLSTVFQMNIKKGLLKTIPDMDNEFVQMTSQIFSCLSRIIAFMPATYYANISNTLLTALYVFATFGSINPSYNSAKLGLVAMTCVNELMSKASVFNSDANEFIYNVFHNTFLILQQLVSTLLKSSNDDKQSLNIVKIDEDYLKKFIDFLKLFIQGHLGRFEKFISFPTKDFLALLLDFTTQMHYSFDCYLMLLETWSIYLDYLESCINVKHKDKTAIGEKLHTIKEPIFALLLFVVRSIQYSCNREYLEQLDDCTVDDDNRTEFEHYVQISIEIIAKIGDIYPDETITFIDNDYFNEKLTNIHYGLEFFVNNQNKPMNGYSLPISNGCKLFPISMCQQPLGQLQLSIYDFVTTLQVCSRFSNSFVDEHFERHFIQTKLKFEKLIEILQFLDLHHCCDVYRLNPLSVEFFRLKAQLLATFKAYIVWFQQFYCSSASSSTSSSSSSSVTVSPTNEKNSQLSSAENLLTIIFNTCCSIICDTSLINFRHGTDQLFIAKQKLFHSAALTLNTFSANVRPAMVFGLGTVQRLFDQNVLVNVLQLCDINSNINDSTTVASSSQMSSSQSQDKTIDSNGCQSVTLTDQILISQSISNLLILPWFGIPNELQEWERRSHCINVFVGNFLQLFNKLNFDNVELSNVNALNTIKGSLARNLKEGGKRCPNVFCRSLYILKKVIKSHADSPIKSKQMLFMSLESSLEAFIQLLVHNSFLHSTVIGCQITEHILALFLVVFDVLLAQVHIDFVKRTIQTLLQIINTHDIMAPPSNDGQTHQFCAQKETSALKVVTKFLKLLCLIIKQTSFNASLRSLLPGIVEFTVLNIQTNLIGIKSNANIYFSNLSGPHYDTYGKLLQVYYRFLYELMLNNCRYFFPLSNVNKISFGTSSTLNLNNSETNGNVNSHQRHFEGIMEIIGQSFQQPENVQLYRQNVEAFESLNETIKLYSRPAFKSTFLERFLYLFVQMLLDRSLELLNELLYTVIYHLSMVDFDHLYNEFIPKFLSNLHDLNDVQRRDLICKFNIGRIHSTTHDVQIDFPTFTANLNRMLCDIRYYRKCNITN